MKKVNRFFCFPVFFLIIGCTERYVVLSSTHAMHVKSSKVHQMKIDSTLEVYDHFKLKKKGEVLVINK